MKTLILSFLLAFALYGSAAQADMTSSSAEIKPGSYRLDKSHGKITWSIDHLGFSTYFGQFADVDAQLTLDPVAPANCGLSASVNTASVGTLDAELDKTLKSSDFFSVEKFPAASFTATRIDRTGRNSARITGDLTLMDVTRPIIVDAVFNQAGTDPVTGKYTIGFNGSATLKRSDFGLTKYLPALGDTVSLAIEAEFVEAAEQQTTEPKE